MAAGEIQVSNNGKYIYASNRDNSDPNLNRSSIAVFKVLSNGELELIQHVSSLGQHPRHFDIVPVKSGLQFLLIANKDSNNIVRYDIDEESGLINETSSVIFYSPALLSPAYILALDERVG
jgi:6-phosphogluconolactonase